MKYPFIAIVFLVSVYGSYCQSLEKMKITDLETYISKSEKPLVISFWATFCKPCITEIPYFQQTIKDKYHGEVELVLVSLDLPDYYPAKLSSFAVKSNVTVPIVWLNETNADYFCPRVDVKWSGAIPATLMVNNKKNYRKFYGQQLTPLQLERELKLLAQ